MFSVFNESNVMRETLQDYIERRLQPWTLMTYAFMVLNKRNLSDVLFISDYPPAWQEQYRANHYHQRDPVVLSGLKRTTPFCWDEHITFRLSDIFLLSKTYNIVNGVTFVLHDHFNNMAMLSLVTDNTVEQSEELITHSRARLQMVLIDIAEQTYRLLNTRQTESTVGPPLPGRSTFTPREQEVLYWASMGKTYEDVAIILGITVRTVKFHMANVVRKLNVSNARQAIRLGVERNLIMPTLR